ncbi:hypothetical protein MVI01_51020 [Myxococcus virescens]|uniref:Uncharacterized protein n=1 Tax=Myxococcus virescens TaxID=83456 RepID=A0A511HIC1_9BACT|nr:hypothetical protein MVI01_51020 [Myxococcus virescens]
MRGATADCRTERATPSFGLPTGPGQRVRRCLCLVTRFVKVASAQQVLHTREAAANLRELSDLRSTQKPEL